MKNSAKELAYSALFLAIGLLLPFVTGQIPTLGKMLLPMHFPVILCGFVCGWKQGLVVGAITPLLRSIAFGSPVLMPMAAAMAFELAAYGGIAGFLYKVLPHKRIFLIVDLAFAMVVGRIVWGFVAMPLYGAAGQTFTILMFVQGALLMAIPGIILQFIIIPIIVNSLQRRGLTLVPDPDSVYEKENLV